MSWATAVRKIGQDLIDNPDSWSWRPGWNHEYCRLAKYSGEQEIELVVESKIIGYDVRVILEDRRYNKFGGIINNVHPTTLDFPKDMRKEIVRAFRKVDRRHKEKKWAEANNERKAQMDRIEKLAEKL